MTCIGPLNMPKYSHYQEPVLLRTIYDIASAVKRSAMPHRLRSKIRKEVIKNNR